MSQWLGVLSLFTLAGSPVVYTGSLCNAALIPRIPRLIVLYHRPKCLCLSISLSVKYTCIVQTRHQTCHLSLYVRLNHSRNFSLATKRNTTTTKRGQVASISEISHHGFLCQVAVSFLCQFVCGRLDEVIYAEKLHFKFGFILTKMFSKLFQFSSEWYLCVLQSSPSRLSVFTMLLLKHLQPRC